MSSQVSDIAMSVAGAIDEDRLWANLMAMAEIGARSDGGVNRQALTREDGDARALLIGWARERGYDVSVDAAANLFIQRRGREAGQPVLIGSHMDSQPAGGRFDGIYGVLAAFETLVALDAASLETRHPVEVVAWTNEEGGRFACGCTGSIAWSGLQPVEDFLGEVGADGVILADALAETLAATPDVPKRSLGGGAIAYIEPHIEQGPVLEAGGLQIAAVTSIQGLRWYRVDIAGSAGHAGTTPMQGREDAFQAALRSVQALNTLMDDPADTVRFTVGRINVEPNSPNTIPSSASFTIDFRHPDADVLADLGGRVERCVVEAAAPCGVTVTETSTMAPAMFPEPVVAQIEASAGALGFGVTRLPSGAFHDALFASKACPSGMIFIPCRGGLSHHPDEYATPFDCAAGARVLAATVAELAGAAPR